MRIRKATPPSSIEHTIINDDYNNVLKQPPGTPEYRDVLARAESFSLILTDPVYDTLVINKLISNYRKHFERHGAGLIVFMYPHQLFDLQREYKPHQITHWVKPVSTKNTTKNYSNFIEACAMWNVTFGHRKTHWSTRTGVFTDTLVSNEEHPWKKPESLIEKLLMNHYSGDGIVFDPFAGSFTVDTVCRRLGIPSVSIERDPKYVDAYVHTIDDERW